MRYNLLRGGYVLCSSAWGKVARVQRNKKRITKNVNMEPEIKIISKNCVNSKHIAHWLHTTEKEYNKLTGQHLNNMKETTPQIKTAAEILNAIYPIIMDKNFTWAEKSTLILKAMNEFAYQFRLSPELVEYMEKHLKLSIQSNENCIKGGVISKSEYQSNKYWFNNFLIEINQLKGGK